ncbi:hypothetical protein ACFPER_16615 [Agromyces aurantiacus]|uniref:Integral membrane protein n=1 Tax=Agromyces aurantiacus TaxID=165814 RepID=A0ABV9RAT5_9MICO|nr:hypothetical protein [Agromyces aurantiacus]MBM7504685.1 vacuolar-type H+-ATPase subunit I/STV1 [Agromyces aurantiacus]
MEILKNVILAIHIIGVAALLGGVLYQLGAMRQGKGRILTAMMHGAWTMLATGILLVGLQYPLGHEVNNAKVTVKLVVLVAIIVIALVNRKKDAVASWVLPTIGGLTVLNVLLATVWR